jgi:hypothetical protein
MKSGKIFVHEFIDENKKQAKYWRDVGELDACCARFRVSPCGGVMIPKGAGVR